MLDLIEQTGGMFGLRSGASQVTSQPNSQVANDCAGSSKSFAQALSYLVDRGVDVAFAIDLNGMINNSAPRFIDYSSRKTRRRGRKATCLGNRYEQSLQRGWVQDDPLTPYTDESAYNIKGLSHIGMLGAYLDDLDRVGLAQPYLDHLYGSAESFVQMWESIP